MDSFFVRCAFLGVVALLAACSGGEDAGADAGEPPPAAAPAGHDVAAPGAEAMLAVEAEGVRLFDPAGGAARPLAFGMPAEQVLRALEPLRGAAERSENPECGGGGLAFAAWDDGLTLVIDDGTFRGWALDERATARIGTASGIGVGSTRAELEGAYTVEVEESTLGTEFRAGEMSGVLDGDGPDARINALWAGLACLFR